MRAEDYVSPGGGFAEQAQDVSGVPAAAPGMAPYPLYGIPSGMGVDEPTVVFYKRPWFCWTVGIGLGLVGGFVVGQATAGIGMLLLTDMLKPNKKKRRKKAPEDE
jgi:hypothetical protein